MLCVNRSQFPITLNNSITIPITNPNNYTLNLEVYSSLSETCDYYELTDTATLQFTTPLTETVYLGVEDFEVIGNQISVYPNPVTDNLNINVSSGLDIKKIEIYNMLGREIKSYSNGFESVDVSGLSNGVYFITFNTNRGVAQKRILVKN